MDPNTLAQELIKRGGYNPTDAANSARGPRAAELAKEFGLSTPSTPSPTSFQTGQSSFDPIATARQIQGFQQEANKPVVASLEAQKAPLKDRYDSIINSLKSNQTKEEDRATMAVRNEYASRGIYGGGILDREMTNTLNPITERYNNLYQQTGAGYNQDILSLATQIAQLNAGQPAQSLQSALSIAQLQNQLGQQGIENKRAQETQDLTKQAQELALRKYQEIDLPTSRYNVNKPYYDPKTGGGGNDPLGLF